MSGDARLCRLAARWRALALISAFLTALGFPFASRATENRVERFSIGAPQPPENAVVVESARTGHVEYEYFTESDGRHGFRFWTKNASSWQDWSFQLATLGTTRGNCADIRNSQINALADGKVAPWDVFSVDWNTFSDWREIPEGKMTACFYYMSVEDFHAIRLKMLNWARKFYGQQNIIVFPADVVGRKISDQARSVQGQIGEVGKSVDAELLDVRTELEAQIQALTERVDRLERARVEEAERNASGP